MRLPKVIGHRGAAAEAPENTLAGIRWARALGVDWIEVDVRLTADSRPVLFHDETLERTTNGRGRLAETTLAELRPLDAGSSFGDRFAGERVPTLEEALSLARALGLGVNVELKAPPPGGEEETAEAALAALAARPLPPGSLLVSSGSAKALAAVRGLSPGTPLGLVLHGVDPGGSAAARSQGCVSVHVDHETLSPPAVAELREAGFLVLAFTVNDAARARELFAWGVLAVFSDSPQAILRAL